MLKDLINYLVSKDYTVEEAEAAIKKYGYIVSEGVNHNNSIEDIGDEIIEHHSLHLDMSGGVS